MARRTGLFPDEPMLPPVRSLVILLVASVAGIFGCATHDIPNSDV